MLQRPLVMRQATANPVMNEEFARLAYEGVWNRYHAMAVNQPSIRANHMNQSQGGRSYRKKRSGRSKRRMHRKTYRRRR
jgi:hypothetical protein